MRVDVPKGSESSDPAEGDFHDQLLLATTGQPVLRIPAVAVMFAETLYGAPALLPELVNRWGAVHRVLIMVTVRQVSSCMFTDMQTSMYTKFYICQPDESVTRASRRWTATFQLPCPWASANVLHVSVVLLVTSFASGMQWCAGSCEHCDRGIDAVLVATRTVDRTETL